MVFPRRKVLGAGIPDMPLVDRFFNPVGVENAGLENDGRRVGRVELIVARILNCSARSSSSSMYVMPLIGVDCPAGLLSDERGRRLSVVGLVE